jgi:type VI secretion system secreted protein Hcp
VGPAGPTGPAGPAGASGPGAPNKQVAGNVVFQAEKQGTITGDAGPLSILSFSWNVTNPTDPATGLGTGKVQVGAFTIVKAVDAASPKLALALATGERLTRIDLNILSATGDTVETFKFTNAVLTSITQSEMGALGDQPLEQISFQFQSFQLSVGSTTTTIDATNGKVAIAATGP